MVGRKRVAGQHACTVRGCQLVLLAIRFAHIAPIMAGVQVDQPVDGDIGSLKDAQSARRGDEHAEL
ncbi:hypothetical protein A6456_33055 [Paraburkholderia tropica]|nr:hypothetical protein A6456_33055 [Paraburkholderia tropica]